MLTRALKTLSRVHSCNAKQSGQLRCECEDCSVSRVPASSLRVRASPCGWVVYACGSNLRLRRHCMRQRLVRAVSLHVAAPCTRRLQRLVSARVAACRRRWRKVRWRKVCPFALAAWPACSFAVSSAAGGASCALKLSRLGNGHRLLRAVVVCGLACRPLLGAEEWGHLKTSLC
jgi:hypothetical protein